jgi:midasin
LLRKSASLHSKISLLGEFISQNGSSLVHGAEFWQSKLASLQKSLSRGKSTFEWVDSVLIKSILEGEWAVFENANLCNPSILDRLNSLLEEGNQSLCINEQGLVDGDQLRDVKSHPEFRAIFILSRQSLIDQGRDVSRALRNRCL